VKFTPTLFAIAIVLALAVFLLRWKHRPRPKPAHPFSLTPKDLPGIIHSSWGSQAVTASGSSISAAPG